MAHYAELSQARLSQARLSQDWLSRARDGRVYRWSDAGLTAAALSLGEVCTGLWPWFSGRSTESVVALFVNEFCGLVGWDVYEGNVDCACLPMRTMINEALTLNAAGILLAHNHPSGDSRPSLADILTTKRLCALAVELELRVIDHLVFAGTSACFSYRQQGLL